MFSSVWGVSSIAGPLVGGYVTDAISWRWVFAGEVVLVIVILLLTRRIADAPSERRPRSMSCWETAV